MTDKQIKDLTEKTSIAGTDFFPVDDASNVTWKISWANATGIVDGWVAAGATLTYTSADGATGVISTGSDLTGSVGVGDKIKLTQTTVKYFIVIAITASVLTVWGGTDYTLVSATITVPYFSHSKSPLGFPVSPAKWTVETTSTSNSAKSTPTQNTWYGDTGLSATGPNIIIPIGLWNVEYEATIDGGKSSATAVDVYATLSTASNSESDVDFTTFAYTGGASGLVNAVNTVYRRKLLSLAAKATYYLNIKTDVVGTGATISVDGATVKTFIRAICAYL